jgi:hypothetical protein
MLKAKIVDGAQLLARQHDLEPLFPQTTRSAVLHDEALRLDEGTKAKCPKRRYCSEAVHFLTPWIEGCQLEPTY